MRAILFILILAVAAVIVALGTGLVDIDQTRGVEVPEVQATGNGVSASGGQAPAFDIETGSVQVGTTQANVTVPSLEIQPAGNDAQPSGNNVVAP
jgi:hypothetical protein